MKRKSTHTIPFRDTEATVSGTYSPPTRETRMDPSEPAEFGISTVSIDGNEISPNDLTDAEAADITARMIEECAEEDDEGPDDNRDERMGR